MPVFTVAQKSEIVLFLPFDIAGLTVWPYLLYGAVSSLNFGLNCCQRSEQCTFFTLGTEVRVSLLKEEISLSLTLYLFSDLRFIAVLH